MGTIKIFKKDGNHLELPMKFNQGYGILRLFHNDYPEIQFYKNEELEIIKTSNIKAISLKAKIRRIDDSLPILKIIMDSDTHEIRYQMLTQAKRQMDYKPESKYTTFYDDDDWNVLLVRTKEITLVELISQ